MSGRSISRLLALFWALLCALCLGFAISSLHDKPAQSDLLALLPQSAESQNEALLRTQLAKPFERTITVAVLAPTEEKADEVEAVLSAWVTQHKALFSSGDTQPQTVIASIKNRALYAMTAADEMTLSALSTDVLLRNTLTALTTPLVTGAFSFIDDPFQTALHWLQERSGDVQLMPRGDFFLMQENGHLWVLAFFRLNSESVLSQSTSVQAALSALETSLNTTVGADRVFFTGMPLFTLQAAQTAEKELTVLGSISLIGIVLLGWYWFGNLRTLACILAVTLQSFAFATAACLFIFGEIHLIALVFGTTLIGITVDYSAHYFCKRLGQTRVAALASLKALLPDLSLALVSTLTAFAAMALAPLPGLQQMAVFSMSGMVAAFIAVCLWLPVLETKQLPFLERTQRIARFLNAWPTLVNCKARTLALIALLFGLFCVSGISQLKLDASIYELNNADPRLLSQTQTVTALLKTPSSAQYFVVQGKDLQTRLQREEALKEKLLKSAIAGVTLQTNADWTPSQVRQARIDAIKVGLCEKINPELINAVGISLPCERYAGANKSFDPVDAKLLPPSIESDQSLSLVLVKGVTAANVKELSQLAQGLEGVAWRNYPEELSATLNHYRDLMAQLLGLGIVFVALILFVRFKLRFVNAFLPTLAGIAFTLAVLGYSGQTVSLFTAAACVLLLGLGIDYGIFLTAGGSSNRSLCAITFAALTTLLSFGLLAFSSTPALQSFGLTVAIGETFIWLATPLLRYPREHWLIFAEKQASNDHFFGQK